MDSQQPTSSPPSPGVKKVLVKRVKVLVKRPVSPPPAQLATVASVKRPVAVKVSVQRSVQPQTAAYATQIPTPAAAPALTVDQTVSNADFDTLRYTLPDDIMDSVAQCEKIPNKFFLLYIYARTYVEQTAEDRGMRLPELRIFLPRNRSQIQDMADSIDDDFFKNIQSDFVDMAPFIPHMQQAVSNKTPLNDLVRSEVARLQGRSTLTADQQILLTYLNLMLDLQIIQEKINIAHTKKNISSIIGDIKEIESNQRKMKKAFVDAIKRKGFPVDAEKLMTNYFTLAKKEPEKAYDTLISNPMFFAPIQMEKLPKKLFGLIKPTAKDAININKRLASFIKHLKITL